MFLGSRLRAGRQALSWDPIILSPWPASLEPDFESCQFESIFTSRLSLDRAHPGPARFRSDRPSRLYWERLHRSAPFARPSKTPSINFNQSLVPAGSRLLSHLETSGRPIKLTRETFVNV